MMGQGDQLKFSGNDNNHFITIAGNIGSGKTTLTKKLASHFSWNSYFESVQDNPYLADFYTDMKRWSFPLQVYFLTHRFKTHKEIESSKTVSIQDRSIYEDAHIFARSLFEAGDMSDKDYENYMTLYMTMSSFLKPPGLMIYLRRSIPFLSERIFRRGRDYEKVISRDYLERLNQYYEQWCQSYTMGKILFVNTDKLDFLENEHDFLQLVEKIQTLLGGREQMLEF